MHARATTLKGDPGRIDAAIEEYRDALSRFLEIDGNRGAMLLVDRDAGRGVGITLWEDEQAMQASRERAQQLRSQAAESVAAEVESVAEYEVAVWQPA